MELLGLEAEPVFLFKGLVGLNTQEGVVRFRVVLVQVVTVVGRGKQQAVFAGHLDEARVDAVLFGQAVVLELDEEVLFSKKANVAGERLFRLLELFAQEKLGDLAAQAGGRGDKPVGMTRQGLEIDAGLVMESFQVADGTQFAEVSVARFVLAEQEQMVVCGRLRFCGAVGAVPRRNVEFGPDDRLDLLGFGRLKEVDHAEHRAVVGNGACAHSVVSTAVEKLRNLDRSVQHAVFGVDMQMAESGVH